MAGKNHNHCYHYKCVFKIHTHVYNDNIRTGKGNRTHEKQKNKIKYKATNKHA